MGEYGWLVHNCNVIIEPDKSKYLFGEVAGSNHNYARSTQLGLEFQRLGLYDTDTGRKLLLEHFEIAARSGNNTISSFSNEFGSFVIKDSLFIGPSGKAARLQTTFQALEDGSYRFVTTIPQHGGW